MSCDAGEQRARRLVLEQHPAQQSRRTERRDSKPRERERMPRQMQNRLQKFGRQFLPLTRERLHQTAVSARVAAELFRCKIHVAVEARGSPIPKRMGEGNFGLDPFKTKLFQRKRFEKGGANCERMDRRANVVQKSWQC